MNIKEQLNKIIEGILIVVIGMLFIFSCNYSSCTDDNIYYKNVQKKSLNVNAPIVQPLTIKALEVAPKDVVTDYSNKSTEEKFDISVNKLNFLTIKHSNAQFDFHSDVTMEAYIEDTTIVLNELGNYGREGVYRYFTITSILGPIYKGKYNIVVKRNCNTRSNFKIEVK